MQIQFSSLASWFWNKVFQDKSSFSCSINPFHKLQVNWITNCFNLENIFLFCIFDISKVFLKNGEISGTLKFGLCSFWMPLQGRAEFATLSLWPFVLMTVNLLYHFFEVSLSKFCGIFLRFGIFFTEMVFFYAVVFF